MRNMSLIRRALLVVISILMVAFPIVLYVLTKPNISVLIPTPLNFFNAPSSDMQFSTESQLPGYTLSLADTRFLGYVTETVDIFASNALADPRHWRKQFNITQRASVTRVKFVLVQQVSSPIGYVVNPKTAEILGRGGYDVDGDTMVIRVALDTEALAKAGKADTRSLEDTFLNTAIQTMYYAKGKVDPGEDRRIFGQLKVDMEQYLYKMGVFIWPFRIAQVNT